jgi:hypothetical protein
MKVSKMITVETEVEVAVSMADIASSIMDGIEVTPAVTVSEVIQGLNNALSFIKAVPDEAIAALKPSVMKIVVQVLESEAKRYAVGMKSTEDGRPA